MDIITYQHYQDDYILLTRLRDIPESCDEYMQKRIRRQKIKDFLMDCIPVVVVGLILLSGLQ